MEIVPDWDWGTFVPPGLSVTHILPLTDPTEARKPWLLSQVGENPQPRPQISAPPENLRGRRNGNRLPLPSKYNVPSRVQQDGQCFLTILGRCLGSGKTQARDPES